MACFRVAVEIRGWIPGTQHDVHLSIPEVQSSRNKQLQALLCIPCAAIDSVAGRITVSLPFDDSH